MRASTSTTLGVSTLLVMAVVGPVAAQSAVIIVRHGEKAEQSADPPLSEAGRRRAERLGEMLRDAGVTAIYATEYKRTQDTVQPLARRLSIAVGIVAAGDLETLVRRIRMTREGIVVVAGHSHTVPRILAQLGSSGTVTIPEDEYDNLFIVVPRNGPASVVRLRF